MKIKGKSNSDIERFVKIVNDDGKFLLTTDSVILNSKEIKYIKICLNDLYIDEKRVNEINCLMQNYSKLV